MLAEGDIRCSSWLLGVAETLELDCELLSDGVDGTSCTEASIGCLGVSKEGVVFIARRVGVRCIFWSIIVTRAVFR